MGTLTQVLPLPRAFLPSTMTVKHPTFLFAMAVLARCASLARAQSRSACVTDYSPPVFLGATYPANESPLGTLTACIKIPDGRTGMFPILDVVVQIAISPALDMQIQLPKSLAVIWRLPCKSGNDRITVNWPIVRDVLSHAQNTLNANGEIITRQTYVSATAEDIPCDSLSPRVAGVSWLWSQAVVDYHPPSGDGQATNPSARYVSKPDVLKHA